MDGNLEMLTGAALVDRRGAVPADGALFGDDPAPRPFKRAFDLAISLIALPAVALAATVLLCINPAWNRGPLFYRQARMGLGGRPFTALKFRTMRCAPAITRGPDDPLEHDRITALGRFLRRMRIDELPQFLNVLRGDMSVVGPRPDYWDHAVHYSDVVPGYIRRYAVRPGITGLAQVDGGYAEGVSATADKTKLDLRYIREGGALMEFYVIWRTVRVVLTGSGAR